MAADDTSVSISLNRACNQGCAFCVVRGAEREPAEVRARRALDQVQGAARAGVREVVFTGAEPTREPWLARIVAAAKRAGIGRLRLETNATLLATGNTARELRAAGLDAAVVACNALAADVNDAVTGDPGGTARTLAGVRQLCDAGIDVELAVALTPANRGALAAIVGGARDALGASRPLGAVIARPILRGAPGFEPLNVPDLAVELAAAVRATALPGALALRVAPQSELPPCAFVDPVAVVAVLRLGRALVAREATRYVRLPACATCTVASVCPGATAACAQSWGDRALPLTLDPRTLAPDGFEVEPGAAAQPDDPFAALGFVGDPGSAARGRLHATLPVAEKTWAHRHGPAPDREALELAAGLRTLLRRELPRPEQAGAVVETFERLGFGARVVASALEGVTGRARVHVFAALNSATLEEAAALDRELAGPAAARDRAMRRLGELFGYPACCVDAYVRATDQSDAGLLARWAGAGSLESSTVLRGNPFQNAAVVPLRLGSFWPCRFGCREAERQARNAHAELARAQPEWATALLNVLATPVLVQAFDRVAALTGAGRVEAVDGGGQRIRYGGVLGFADLGLDAGVAERIGARAFHAAVVGLLADGDELVWHGDRLDVLRTGAPVGSLGWRGAGLRLLDFAAAAGESERPS